LPRSGQEDVDRGKSSSQTTAGWAIIWVAIGLGALLIVACIWFGGGAANGDDRRPAVMVSV
jgi:uncharacterized SAM-binding protein YcdF (DUF218 family)